MVKGMPSFNIEHDSVCWGCDLRKNIKNKFPRIHTVSREILYLAHYVVSRLMPSPSLSGYLYYVLFIDDFSHKAWIYFMKSKSETFSKFKEYKALVENHTSRHIYSLRANNGGEFDSNVFNEFCIDARICRQLTVPYKPQQNGIVET